jgi:hypothetical protein
VVTSGIFDTQTDGVGIYNLRYAAAKVCIKMRVFTLSAAIVYSPATWPSLRAVEEVVD